MNRHLLRVEGSRAALPVIVGSSTIRAGEPYEPVPGATVTVRQMPRGEKRAFPPLDVVIDFLVEASGRGVAGAFAAHLVKTLGRQVRRMWIDGREVKSQEDIMEILRTAHGTEDDT